MTLSSWIEKTQPKKVARLLKVDPATVSQWRAKETCPRPQTMVKIYKLSKGKVTYKNIVEAYVKAQK